MLACVCLLVLISLTRSSIFDTSVGLLARTSASKSQWPFESRGSTAAGLVEETGNELVRPVSVDLHGHLTQFVHRRDRVLVRTA